MVTFTKFTGINNVLPSHRLDASALSVATNLDVGLSGELRRRSGFTQSDPAPHENVWEADGFLLATSTNGDLTAIRPGVSRTVIYPSLGFDRVWYLNLPNGKTAFSNGLINGITDGTSYTDWGIPVPEKLGELINVNGALPPGDYQYQLTYTRLSDGLEGGPLYSNPVTVKSGFVLVGLDNLPGFKLNVYVTGQNGEYGYLAGTASAGMFTFTDPLSSNIPCATEYCGPAPAGTVSAFWRGRALVAQGSVLWASRVGQWELFDLRRDFKQFSAPITLVQPVDGGIFVGTTDELCFLAGTEFDKLVYARKVEGSTVLGSGVSVRGELITRAKDVAEGTAMICIADRAVVAGFSDGSVLRLTEGRYATDATEVAATFRMNNRIPQYIAVPQ